MYVCIYQGLFWKVESKAMAEIFQKKGKEMLGKNRAKCLKIWAKMYKIQIDTQIDRQIDR